MKRLLSILLAASLALILASCGLKEAVQNKTRELLSGTAPSGGYDAEFVIPIGGRDDWTPFPGKTGVSFTHSDNGVLAISDDGKKISFTGKQTGDSILTASLGGAQIKALVRVRAAEGGSTWTLRIDEATTLDIMSLAVVDYDCDLTATHVGPDMFGEYTGVLGMEYSADLSGLQALMTASGVDMDYKTDGWFKNTSFRMQLARYAEEDEARFVDSLKDPNVTDEERDLMNAYMAGMFAGIGSSDKGFETAGKPVGLWFDWAFHMTEGDMSAYVDMNSAMFSATASQDATAQHAEGYASAILAGSFHESLSYENQSPFPYQIAVYEGGEAVLTLRNPTESPIVVKFYGTLTKG